MNFNPILQCSFNPRFFASLAFTMAISEMYNNHCHLLEHSFYIRISHILFLIHQIGLWIVWQTPHRKRVCHVPRISCTTFIETWLFQFCSFSKTKRTPKPYDTPSQLGIKWQMDVKHVLTSCYSGPAPQQQGGTQPQERFYNHMSFYNYNDLLLQMKRYLNRSNNIPM